MRAPLSQITCALIWATLCASALGGCRKEQRYSQAQLNQIEVRVVDAGIDDAFDAASGALFDAGYLIVMSDKDAGLITGRMTKDLTQEMGFWEAVFTTDYPIQSRTMSVQVLEVSEDESRVRVKLAVNGYTTVDESVVNEIWVLMQRQVMMHEPVEFSETTEVPIDGPQPDE